MRWPRKRQRDDRPPRPIQATASIEGAAAGRWLRANNEAWGRTLSLARGVYVQGASTGPGAASQLMIVFGGEVCDGLPYDANAAQIAQRCIDALARAGLSFERGDRLDLQVYEP